MPIPKQTANFPGFTLPEQSWSNNLRALAKQILPQGILKGLELGLPSSGRTPTLTNGYLVDGDQIAGPFGAKLIDQAPANANRIGLYYGLEGMFYSTAAEAVVPANPMYQEKGVVPRAWLIGEVTTNADSVIAVAQYLHLDTSRFGIRALFRPGSLAKGTDVILAELPLPSGYRNSRISFAIARILTALTGVNTGDQAVVKYRVGSGTPADLLSLSNTNLQAAAGTTLATTAPVYLPPASTTLQILWNLTDADSSITAGALEVNAVLELF